ncbi:MAG: hypothetical protein WAK66_04540, partial [Methylocystis sp.]
MRKSSFEEIDPVDESGHGVADRIGDQVVFEVDAAVRAAAAPFLANNSSGNSNDRHFGRNILDHDGIGAYAGAGSYG